jgi:hypothetical protein
MSAFLWVRFAGWPALHAAFSVGIAMVAHGEPRAARSGALAPEQGSTEISVSRRADCPGSGCGWVSSELAA